MNIILISTDDDLARLCREILQTLSCSDWQLSTASSDNCPADGDFYIWDSPTAAEPPAGFEEHPSKHLFLVHRNETASLYQSLGNVPATVLLKPVTRAALAAFLGSAASAFHDRILATSSLRADRDEILQCLIQSNLKLQEFDQDRTNFLARAVHDFRAPLTATCGYCGLLLSEALGSLEDDQKEVLRRMQNSVKRLSRMASAMFELSVGHQKKRRPDVREADIRDCVEQALHEVNPFANGKRISISVDLDPVPGALYVEPGQIEQLLINLLDNACKFTPRSGEIEVKGYPYFWDRRCEGGSAVSERDRQHQNSRATNTYRIDILDSGPRIPQEHLGNIFEEYTSYGGGQDRSGGGLGLAICKMIVSTHEGDVWAENTDRGPRFSFVIPVRQTEAEFARVQTDSRRWMEGTV